MIGYAIDVSHHQDPALLPWFSFEGRVDAVIVRASYGAELRDRHASEHVRRARAIGASVGVYHFFRPIHSVAKQWDVLRAQCDALGITTGDIVPAIDIEHDPFPRPGVDVTPAWSGPAEELVSRVVDTFGEALVYITAREFRLLGSPAWVLERPLWVAHYTAAATPASPTREGVSGRVVLWQHRVGRFDPRGPGGYDAQHPDLDQNRILAPLPLVGRLPEAPWIDPVETSDEPDTDLDALRDSALTGEELDARDGLIPRVEST